MVCETLAPADNTTCMRQMNSKEQFNYASVLGINIMGNTVPVIYNVLNMPGIVFYNGSRKHRYFRYDDNRYSACCRLVMKFNIDHYTKCYLPGRLGTNDAITTPYEFNHCKKCNATVTDKCGNMLAISRTRHWTNSNVVWRACKVRQSCDDCGNSYPAYEEEDTYDPFNPVLPEVEEEESTIATTKLANTQQVQYNNNHNQDTSQASYQPSCGCGGGK